MKGFKSISDVLPEALGDLDLDEIGVTAVEAGPPMEAPTSAGQPVARQSQKVGQFASVPYAIIDLASRLAEGGKARTFARTLKLVVMDLARYTDWTYNDVIISNGGIAKRNGIGQAGVKASVAVLLKWKVLKKTYPRKNRLAELQRKAPGGFGPGRRYLVWRSPIRWQIPPYDDAVRDATKAWEKYRGKKKGE